MAVNKTFFQWVGNKTKLIPLIKKLLPPAINTYYEPFLGSGALYLNLMPQKAVLADNNPYLINTWQEILKNPQSFISHFLDLEKKLFTLENEDEIDQQKKIQNYKSNYQALLKTFNNDNLDKTNKGALFLLLIRYSFRSQYRCNDIGKLKCSFGYDNATVKFFDDYRLSHLLELQTIFNVNNSVCLHSDFSYVINQAKEGDFIFADPPYAPYNDLQNTEYDQYSNTSWYDTNFNMKQQENLAQTLKKVHLRGVNFLTTNYPTQEILYLYQGFNFNFLFATTNIKKKNIENFEVLISNYRTFHNQRY